MPGNRFSFNVTPTQQFTFDPTKLIVTIGDIDNQAGTFKCTTGLSSSIPGGIIVETRELTLPIAYLDAITGYSSVDNTILNQILSGFHLQLTP